ncbi:hypothetical protein EYF80_034870 [Liparis tanakae]|uniref:Uncharacterized protein n=1 Tax=Liparis tanakae TaxID=230148 RepID=A0A4Z2GP50_9TELE|nr:hypothetical protein EYF80_034870 [Liparis tanakae]
MTSRNSKLTSVNGCDGGNSSLGSRSKAKANSDALKQANKNIKWLFRVFLPFLLEAGASSCVLLSSWKVPTLRACSLFGNTNLHNLAFEPPDDRRQKTRPKHGAPVSCATLMLTVWDCN